MENFKNNNLEISLTLEHGDDKYVNDIYIKFMEVNLNYSLITGGHGMIGSNINFGYKPTSKDMDICDKNSIEKYINRINRISCIIHMAAINLRESEQFKKRAIEININGTTNMLNVAMKYKIPFIYLSSGAVFSSDNSNVKFDETFIPFPNSIYGYTKLAGENISLLYEKTIVIRTGWVFGGNQKNHYKFVENAINNFYTNAEIKASTDFYGSPTYVIDLIEKIKELIETNKYGINHIVNDGIANGYEISMEISNILKIKNQIITKQRAENIPNSGPNRSKTEILETIYASNKMRSWKSALKEYCKLYIEKKQLVESKNSLDECCINLQKWRNRDNCRLCNKRDMKVFLNLEPTPPANHFVKIPTKQECIPLDVAICMDCKHIQLIQIIEPSFLYSNYFYASSTSETMTNHLKKSVIEFIEKTGTGKNDFILEIGANDGVCIKYLIENGFTNVIGVDPAENIKSRNELPIICDFFGSKLLPTLRKKFKPFKLIYSFHCCAHIEDIQDVFKTINEILDDNGIFIIEVGYFYEVFKNNCFDTVYHEHIDYHTVTAMQKFALSQKLFLYEINTNEIQGGSIQFFMCKNNKHLHINKEIETFISNERKLMLHNYDTLLDWKTKIRYCGNDINYIINGLKYFGKKIAGYGASAKSTTFLYQYKILNNALEFIIDDSVYKQDYYSPGLNIPIKRLDILKTEKIDYVLILSWNFSKEIINNLKNYRNSGMRIIIPFPEIKIV